MLYLLPFILYSIFYSIIIFVLRGTLVFPDFLLLLALLLFCGLGTLSEKKIFNVIGIISVFTISFALIRMGIDNTYFVLAETKAAIAILLYYLIVFIISKNKRLIIMNVIVIVLLSILFVPQKLYVNDGGTIEYRAIAYKYIKWNTIRNDGTPYKFNEVHWFPHNFHSLEYYKPIDTPVIKVFTDNQQISCNKGTAHWSKTVDGDNILSMIDSVGPRAMDYKEELVIDNESIINIDTSYNISNVKYFEYKEQYTDNIEYDLDSDNQNKTINVNNLEKGIYIICFKIHNNDDYAEYSFKIDVK